MALVDRVVTNRLTDQMGRNSKDLQVVVFQQFETAGYIAVIAQSLVDFEVVAPAGDLEPVIAPSLCQFADFDKGQVRPLAGKERYRSLHFSLLIARG